MCWLNFEVINKDRKTSPAKEIKRESSLKPKESFKANETASEKKTENAEAKKDIASLVASKVGEMWKFLKLTFFKNFLF